jgi:hypothetical protein
MPMTCTEAHTAVNAGIGMARLRLSLGQKSSIEKGLGSAGELGAAIAVRRFGASAATQAQIS